MSEILTVRLPMGSKETLERFGRAREIIESLIEGLEDRTLVFEDGRIRGTSEERT